MQVDTKKQLIKNSSWQILFSILRAITGFIAAVIIAKALGPGEFGKIQYFFSIYYFLQLIELFSHPSIVKQQLIEGKFSHNKIMGSSFWISFTSLSCALLLTGAISYSLYDNKYLFFAFILAQVGLIGRSLNNMGYYFDSVLESKKFSFSQLSGNLISNISRVVILIFSTSLIYQSLLFSMQFLITGISNLYFYSKHPQKFSITKWSWDKAAASQIIRRSTPLLLSSLASIIFYKIDIVMLEHLVSSSAVGIYSVAAKLSEPWFFFSSAIVTSFFPSVILIKSKTLRGYYYKLTRINSIILVLGFSISIFMTLTSYFWIHYLFGNQYHESISILNVHIWGLPFLFLNNIQHLWEVKEKYLKFALIKALFTAILNIVLNILLIPKYSGLGAAYATVISYIFVGLIFNITTKKSRLYLKIQLRSFLFYKYLTLREFAEILNKVKK